MTILIPAYEPYEKLVNLIEHLMDICDYHIVVVDDGSGDNDALVIDKKGDLYVVSEGEVSLDSLSDKGAWQVLSFGPSLVVDGTIAVNSSSEVGKSMSSNPSTAIGQISALH